MSANSDRYRIAVVDRDRRNRFDLIDTKTGRLVKTYMSLARARIDRQFLNSHDSARVEQSTVGRPSA